MQAEGSAARLLLPGLADEKERTLHRACPQTEPAAFGQAEMQGIAAHFEDDDREGSTFYGRFRQPERVLQLARRGMEKPFRFQPKILQPRSIRATRLQCADGITDPEQRQQPAGILLLFLQSRRNGHRQTACRPCVTGTRRAEFGNRIELQAAFQGVIERFHTERQAWQNTLLPPLASFRQRFPFRRSKRRRGFSLQSGNGFAERKKPLARQGGLRHGVHSIRLVPVMFL